MKKVLLFNPGICSLNKGDEIISKGIMDNISSILKGNIVTNVSTHTPLNLTYMYYLKKYDLKFICGSNILNGRINRIFKQWDINLISSIIYKNSILIGAGWWQEKNKPNLYTKFIYRKIFDKNYIHSVRDEYTKKMLESIGIKNVINTGCPTMWKFTKTFCKSIPKFKSKSVVFTLTDYNKDAINDKKMINLLLKNYDKVYFFVQGEGDYSYLKSLTKNSRINIIGNSLEEYDYFLKNVKCDYIGTRLHGGIRALQYKRRTLIISIDNRAREKKKDFNLPCIERENIEEIEKFIKGKYITKIEIPEENIKKWKKQFKMK